MRRPRTDIFLFFILFLIQTSCSNASKSKMNNKQALQKCGGAGGCGLLGNCSEGNCSGGLKTGCCPDQAIKCCDPSCPKCIGGKAPRPGTGCLEGCPLDGCCPGTCPCDDCVCCYTSTSYTTVFTTCHIETKSVITRQETKTKSTMVDVTETKIVPVTFSVDEIFLFTSTIELTEFAGRPSFTIETLETVNEISQSTIYLLTSSVTELFTTRTGTAFTITTNPIITTTVFISEIAFNSTLSTFIQTQLASELTTVVTGSFVTGIFGFTITSSPIFTFQYTTAVSANLTSVVETFTRTVPYETEPGVTLGTSTLISINSLSTAVYNTAAYSTVSGDWTFYLYNTADVIKTIATTTIDFTRVTTVPRLDTVTETVEVSETSNICPTRTIELSSTTTIYVLDATTITEAIRSGTSTAYSTIASTIVFD